MVLDNNECLYEIDYYKFLLLVYFFWVNIDNVKISVTINEKLFKSNLKINQTLIFTDKSFFYTILGFTQSQSYPLDDIDGFYQLIAGSYKSEKPINITSVDKVHLKCNCINGSIVNGVREPILYSFALDQPPGYIWGNLYQNNELFGCETFPLIEYI